MKRLAVALAATGLAVAALPAPAAGADTDLRRASAAHQADVPRQLSDSERDNYRAVFADLDAGNWAGAAGRLDGMRRGPLHDLALALLYTMPGSPRVEAGPLMDLLPRARDLPQATDLARLAGLRGATDIPDLPRAHALVRLPGQPRRTRGPRIVGDPVADQLEPLINPLLVNDHPQDAESLFAARAGDLSDEARSQYRQRIAWVYFLNGFDSDALRVATDGARGETEWAALSDWVAGLAAWRMRDYDVAARHFDAVAARSRDYELVAAGNYWASRADVAGGHPERAQGRLQAAARLGETFYGLLAQSALAVHRPPTELDPFTERDWQAIEGDPNVRAAVALTEIGEMGRAGDLLRWQARIGDPRDHLALLHLAARLNLTSAQMWLAHNGPRGTHIDTIDRYPEPSWRPARGWRVDPALAFAHALQESGFRPDAVSPAGARGLMQVRPGSAGDMARARGDSVTAAQLDDPVVNLEYGQAYLEYLRDQACTQGLLPKVIASYNAGPAPVTEWNTRYDQSDPLLFIEAIPYWETRGYVPIVLRNYWIYEERDADASPSRRALVAGLWPRFPGMAGPVAVRIAPRNVQTAMGSSTGQAAGD
jgi:soluble lytic murein transglycosylase-like protein